MKFLIDLLSFRKILNKYLYMYLLSVVCEIAKFSCNINSPVRYLLPKNHRFWKKAFVVLKQNVESLYRFEVCIQFYARSNGAEKGFS